MPALKVTRELHAKVRECLKTKGVEDTARAFKLSRQTVHRIKRGKSYLGYKRALAHDHRESFPFVRDDQEPDFRDLMSKPKPGILQRLRRFKR